MANFVLLYSGGGMPEDEAEQAKVMQSWMAWYEMTAKVPKVAVVATTCASRSFSERRPERASLPLRSCCRRSRKRSRNTEPRLNSRISLAWLPLVIIQW